MTLAALSIASYDLRVKRVRGRTALSELFRFEVQTAADEDAPAIADILGKPFTLTLGDGLERTMSVRGIVFEAGRTTLEVHRRSELDLVLLPEVARLSVGRDSRVYQDKTVVDIVKDVLDRGEVPSSSVRWATTATYAKRAYTVQYREDDLSFVTRLLAEEGIYFWFEFDESAMKIVFSDDSTAAPELAGGASIPYRDDNMLRATHDHVIRVKRRAVVAPDRVRLRDYDFEKPRLKLDVDAGSGKHEIYDFPGRFHTPSDGEQLARVRLEALRARTVTIAGEAWTTRLRAGLVCELAEHPIDAFNARYLLDVVEYDVAGDLGGAEASAVMRWSAIPVATPFRAPIGRVARSTGGVQTGVVVGPAGKELYPDRTGRVRVQFFWDRVGARDEKASTVMRVGQFALGGSMIMPRVGWEVIVGHHEADVDAPFVVQHLYDGQFPVPYALPANKTRTAWQTATTPGGGSTNEVRFEDKKGSEELFLNASKDMNVVIGHDRTEKVGVDCTEQIGSNLDVTIGSNLKVGIKSDQTVSVGGSESLTVSGNRSVTVKGAENGSIGGSRTATVKGQTTEANGGRSLTVGGSMMAASALGVSRMVLGSLSVSIGGSWITAAATGLANITAGAGAETVGGAKIQAAPGPCNTTVKGALAETVGGAYVIATGGNAAESAGGSLTVNVGGALIGNAPKILIEAKSQISIRVGGASITMDGSSVEVKAPSVASPGAKIKKKASNVHHN